MSDFKLYHGDCLDVMKTMPDNHVSSIVTDPPYGLSNHSQADVLACLTAWVSGEAYSHKKKGFMGSEIFEWMHLQFYDNVCREQLDFLYHWLGCNYPCQKSGTVQYDVRHSLDYHSVDKCFDRAAKFYVSVLAS